MSSFDAFYNKGFLNLEQNIIFPDPLVAGDSWCFQYWAGDWGSSGYSAEITFAAATTKITSPAVLNQGWYQWNVPGSSTATLQASPYLYNVHVTDPSGSQRITIERGAVKVVCDIKVSGTNVVSQTKLQMMLEALDNTLIQLMGNKTSMVQFAGQMYQMQDIDRLWTVREKLSTQVADEREELRGNKRGRRIVTFFRNM
jgi:hypothetical protein